MKSKRLERALITIYCALAGLISVAVLALFIARYASFGEHVPVYLYPWGGAWGVGDKTLFYVFRMPVMALCLQVMIFGLYPDRIEGWPDAAYRHLRMALIGLSLVVLSQLSINACLTFMEITSVGAGIAICALLAGGIAMTAIGYIRLRGVLKPMCSAMQSPLSLLIDFIFKGCKRKRALLITATAAFMILLVIPSLSL